MVISIQNDLFYDWVNFSYFYDFQIFIFFALAFFIIFQEHDPILSEAYLADCWSAQDDTQDLLPCLYNPLQNIPYTHNFDIHLPSPPFSAITAPHKRKPSLIYPDVCIFYSTILLKTIHIYTALTFYLDPHHHPPHYQMENYDYHQIWMEMENLLSNLASVDLWVITRVVFSINFTYIYYLIYIHVNVGRYLSCQQ